MMASRISRIILFLVVLGLSIIILLSNSSTIVVGYGVPSEKQGLSIIDSVSTNDVVLLSEDIRFDLGLKKSFFQDILIVKNNGDIEVESFKIIYPFQMKNVIVSSNNFSSLPIKLVNYKDTCELEIGLITALEPEFNQSLTIKAELYNIIEPLEDNEYIFIFQYSTSNPVIISIEISLPIGCVLINQTTQTEPVIFPANYNNYTDGQHLIFGWEQVNVEKNQLFLVRFYQAKIDLNVTNTNSGILTYLIGFLIGVAATIIIILIIGYYLIKKEKATIWFISLSKKEKEEPIRPVHLTIPEHKIIKKLEKNGGSMLQSDLVDSLQFSKAAISIYLKKLEQKGVIKKESMGRTNRVVLLVNPTQVKILEDSEEQNKKK